MVSGNMVKVAKAVRRTFAAGGRRKAWLDGEWERGEGGSYQLEQVM